MKCQRCGKENIDPNFPHNCYPLALRFADDLEVCEISATRMKYAADELLRLYAKNEELLEALTFIAEHDLTGTDLTVAGHIAHALIGKARATLQQRLGEKE